MEAVSRLVMLLLLAVSGLVALAAPEPRKEPKVKVEIKQADHSGFYECKGKQDGKPYEGVVIVKKINEVYLVIWHIGPASFSGAAKIDGDKMVVGWTDGKSLVRGIAIYQINSKSIDGEVWSIPGGQRYTESWTFWKSLPKDE